MRCLALMVLGACGDPAVHAPDAGIAPDAARPAELVAAGLGLDFGSVAPGVPTPPLAIDFANVGGSATGPVAITTDRPEIALGSTSCLPLAPGAHCVTFATLTLTGPGAFDAKITATATPGGTATATVVATGKTNADIVIAPQGTHDFGDVAVGTISAAQTFTVTNPGFAVTGPITVTASGSVAQFVVQTDTCSGAALGPAQTCKLAIAFAPIAATSSAIASFSIVAMPGGTVTASVRGVAHLPVPLSISPATHDFGIQSTSCHDNATAFVVTNGLDVTTAPLAVAISGPGFAIRSDACSGHVLAPQGTCTIVAAFGVTAPTGTQTGMLVASAGTDSATASLSGLAVTDAGGFIQVNPTTLSFGTLQAGTTATMMVTVTNNGSCPTSALQLALGGPNNDQFVIVPGASDTCTGASLANGASCTASVKFKPTTMGTQTATLIVSATTGGTAGVALTGTGVVAPFLVTPPSHDFGSIGPVDTCSPRTQVFTFTNNTGVPTGALVATISGLGFSIAADACTGANLASNASCTVAVHFDVTVPAGNKSATLSVAGTTLNVQAFVSGAVITAAGLTDNAPALAFGTVTPGTTSTMTVTFTNDGATPTSPLQLQFDGMDPTAFSATSDACTTHSLANGESCAVTFAFSPMTTTSRTARATVTGMTGGTACVALSGD